MNGNNYNNHLKLCLPIALVQKFMSNTFKSTVRNQAYSSNTLDIAYKKICFDKNRHDMPISILLLDH